MRCLVKTTRRVAVFGLLALALSAGVGPFARLAWADDPATTPAVAIDNFTFGPATLTVPIGTTVVWTNRDDIPHTVTSDKSPPLFRSKPLDTGDTFKATFDKPGTYGYFCSLHPHMQGTIVVK